MKRVISVMLLATFLSRCATVEDQAILEGCGIGAVVGGLLGAAVGGVSGGGRGAAIGAGAGAVGGCITGYVLANQIVKRREELAGKENDLDARIAFVRGLNEDAAAYNKQLASDVASYDAKIAQHKQQSQKLAVMRKELMQKSEDAKNQLAAVEKEFVELKSFRTQQAKVSKGKPSKDLDAEIAKLETTVKQLRTNTTALANQSQRV